MSDVIGICEWGKTKRAMPAVKPAYRFETYSDFLNHYLANGGDYRGHAYPIVAATWKAAREVV